MTGFVYLWGWLALRVRTFDRQFGLELPLWSKVAGEILMVIGGCIALLCVGTFVLKGRGTPAPFDAPREFVAVGPYKIIRNPMYIGGFILLIGFSLFEQSVSMVVFSIAWLLLAHLFVVFVEELDLETKFGQSYIEYKRSVNRWLPR